MSLKTDRASLEAQRGRPGPGAAGVPPPRLPTPGAAGSQPCQRATALSPAVSLRMCCSDSKEEGEGEREACPQDSEGSHSRSVM